MNLISIKIANDLDQDVAIQICANHEKSTSKAATLGAAFSVKVGSVSVKTLLGGISSGWLPWLYLTATCSKAPTSGSLTAWLVSAAGESELFFDAVAIRDIATHTSGILRWL